jgi:hypothetical protein
MTTSEWISVLALIISTGGFAITLRNWFMSGPRLHLSVMGDALSIPDDGKGARLALIVINRGTTATMLTHMIAYSFPSRWRRWRFKAEYAAVVNSTTIPCQLDVNKTWMGYAFYDDESRKHRADGHLYVDVISAHSNKNFLIKVPPEKPMNVPTKKQLGA